MKTTSPRLLLLIATILGTAPGTNCYSAVSIVDSFGDGGFVISRNGNPDSSDETVDLPLGRERRAAFRIAPTPPDTAFTSTLNASTGTLTYIVTGTTLFSTTPPSLQLVYFSGGPYDITGWTNFILGFSELSGVGTLFIEVGSSDGSVGEHRVDLTRPGDVFYSVTDVKPNSIHTVGSFNILRFVFEARSLEFSFTLDEIRLVQEPSGALLALAAGAGLLARRRRST